MPVDYKAKIKKLKVDYRNIHRSYSDLKYAVDQLVNLYTKLFNVDDLKYSNREKQLGDIQERLVKLTKERRPRLVSDNMVSVDVSVLRSFEEQVKALRELLSDATAIPSNLAKRLEHRDSVKEAQENLMKDGRRIY